MTTNTPTSSYVLVALADVLETRLNADPETSYVASLLNDGVEKVLEKIAEESAETIEAATEDDEQHLISEVADLWFHTMVLLAQKGLRPEQVMAELEKRFGVSGHTEKLSRKARE